MSTENSKTNEPHKFVLSLSRSSDKHVALEVLEVQINMLLFQNLSIYYTWKNIKKLYKKNKLKMIAPTWNDKYGLPDGSYSVSDIQDYIEFILNKHDKLTAISPIHVYVNRINNRLVFKIKDGIK